MSEQTFVYLRSGDRVGATHTRCLTNSPILLHLSKKGGGAMALPEGRETLEFRKEKEAEGVDFKYRIAEFSEWFKDQADETVQKWFGTHENSVYPVEAPEGTFWQEWADVDGNWTVGLLSMTDGQPVEGHEDLIAEVREALLKKSAGEEAGEPVPSDESDDSEEESEEVDEEVEEEVEEEEEAPSTDSDEDEEESDEE